MPLPEPLLPDDDDGPCADLELIERLAEAVQAGDETLVAEVDVRAKLQAGTLFERRKGKKKGVTQ